MDEAMAERAREWLPIETAPKDETTVDLWTDDGRVTDMGWIGDMWAGPMAVHDGWGYVTEKEATHWMPLPAPPADDTIAIPRLSGDQGAK